MNNIELMYTFAKEYRDDIAIDLIKNSDELLNNDATLKILIEKFVEFDKEYEEYRENVLRGLRLGDVLYKNIQEERTTYKTVIYDLLIKGKY